MQIHFHREEFIIENRYDSTNQIDILIKLLGLIQNDMYLDLNRKRNTQLPHIYIYIYPSCPKKFNDENMILLNHAEAVVAIY
jgi:hypothetical protein